MCRRQHTRLHLFQQLMVVPHLLLEGRAIVVPASAGEEIQAGVAEGHLQRAQAPLGARLTRTNA